MSFLFPKSDRRLTQYEMEMVGLNRMVYKLPEQRTNYMDYEYIGWLSNTEHGVFKRGNTIFFIIKGTNNIDNLLTDALLIMNIIDKSFKKDEEKYLLIKKTYPNHNIKISGHSLGGTKSLNLSLKYKELSGITFNSFIPKITYKFMEMINNTDSIIKIVNSGDILSNKAMKINRKKVVVLVNKFFQADMYKTHSLSCYTEDCFNY